MKKTFVLFAILFGLSVATSAQVKKAPAPERQGWEDWYGDLYGDVESVTIINYKLEDRLGKWVKVIKDSVSYKFNLRGDVVEGAEYNSDGSLWAKYTYKYDSAGNMVTETYYEYKFGTMTPAEQMEWEIVYR